METNPLFEQAKNAILTSSKEKALEVIRQAMTEKMNPIDLMNKGFIPGINEVGDRFGYGQLFLPELIQAADVMRAVMEGLKELFPEQKDQQMGKIVIGTVEGDIHDIGKTIVVSLFKANGFEVFDLGRDVPTENLIAKAEEVGANIIGTSALLTTTMEAQRRLEAALKSKGLKGKFKTMVGGAPVTQRWADRIGADAYAEDATAAVKKAKQLLGMG
jgi:trimethylamine corrinoid protein